MSETEKLREIPEDAAGIEVSEESYRLAEQVAPFIWVGATWADSNLKAATMGIAEANGINLTEAFSVVLARIYDLRPECMEPDRAMLQMIDEDMAKMEREEEYTA